MLRDYDITPERKTEANDNLVDIINFNMRNVEVKQCPSNTFIRFTLEFRDYRLAHVASLN
jgi:hypothetical protein